jgi:hypothetical protein
MGLVEFGVVIPGGGGSKELALRVLQIYSTK